MKEMPISKGPFPYRGILLKLSKKKQEERYLTQPQAIPYPISHIYLSLMRVLVNIPQKYCPTHE